MTARDQRHAPEAVRITTAAPSRSKEIAARQRRYLESMAIRTLCFILAVVVHVVWLQVIFIIGAVFLPYVAVVMANAAESKAVDAELPLAPSEHPELDTRKDD